MAKEKKLSKKGGIKTFINDLKGELKRVTWADKAKLKKTTGAVFVVLVMFVAVIFLADQVTSYALRLSNIDAPKSVEILDPSDAIGQELPEVNELIPSDPAK